MRSAEGVKTTLPFLLPHNEDPDLERTRGLGGSDGGGDIISSEHVIIPYTHTDRFFIAHRLKMT